MPKHKKRKIAGRLEPNQPWERQSDEPDTAWSAFVQYRDLGPEKRAFSEMARTTGKHIHTFAVLSTKWDWVARCAAYDAYLDREAVREEVKAIREMRKRHIEFAMTFQGAAALALNKIVKAERQVMTDEKGKPILDADGNPVIGPLTLKPNEVKELAELGMKIERLNRGEPETINLTKNQEVPPDPVPRANYSALSIKELRIMRSMLRKARAGK